jgi:hypothetical protein
MHLDRVVLPPVVDRAGAVDGDGVVILGVGILVAPTGGKQQSGESEKEVTSVEFAHGRVRN